MPDIRLVNGSSGSDWPVVVESGTTGFVWKKKKEKSMRFFFFNPLVFREGGGQGDKNREGEGKKSKRDDE